MFSNENNGYNKQEVDAYIAKMKESYEKALMEERIKVLDCERKILEFRNRTQDIERRERNIQSMLESFKKVHVEGSSNIDILRGKQLKLIYLQLQEFMQELNIRYPGVLVNKAYKKITNDIQSVLLKVSKKDNTYAGTDNDTMRILLNKMQAKRESGNVKEVRIERSGEFKQHPSFIKPVTEMQLSDGDGYDNLVDKFLASKPAEEQPKAMPITSNGFDLREAVTPTEDLSEIMKAFDFFGGNDEDEQ
ncbi:MAG: hypothetical protein IJY90_01680 [Clostridia bacterium]|nr:hypothetical protein [Clostridia bacterium]